MIQYKIKISPQKRLFETDKPCRKNREALKWRTRTRIHLAFTRLIYINCVKDLKNYREKRVAIIYQFCEPGLRMTSGYDLESIWIIIIRAEF